MNVDEAMAIAAKQVGTEQWYYETIEALEVLRVEVERLRAEVQRLDMAGTHSCHDDCQRLPCAQRREIERLRAELAAAKADVERLNQMLQPAAQAASVVPVQVIDCYSFGDDVEVVCKCGDDADRLSGWIRERMKENSI